MPLLLAGCRKPVPGSEEVPPGIAKLPGVFEDVAPRWSHDGARIAFLRRTTDRKYQLCVATADLKQVTPLLAPQYISPDRPFRTAKTGWRAPECLEWSPDDRTIVYPQVEWMTFPDGEKLPGMGLWSYDVAARKAAPLAVHPKEYKGALYFYRSPTWAPDGKHIAFVGEGLRGETALFVVPSSGRRAEIEVPRYDSFQDCGWPAWSPDGKRLAFRQGILRGYTADPVETIRVISPAGTEAGRVWATTPERYEELVAKQPLVPPAERGGPQETSSPKVAGIAWSPDGSTIAFTVSRDPTKPLTSATWTLDLNTAGSQPRAIAGLDPSVDVRFVSPVWLDSTRLGAIGTGKGQRIDADEILLNPETGPRSDVVTLADLPSADFDWSPDRTRIVCAAGPNMHPANPPLTTLSLISLGESPKPQAR